MGRYAPGLARKSDKRGQHRWDPEPNFRVLHRTPFVEGNLNFLASVRVAALGGPTADLGAFMLIGPIFSTQLNSVQGLRCGN